MWGLAVATKILATALLVFSGKSGLVGSGVAIRNERFLVQNTGGAWPGVKTHPFYKAPSDLHVKIFETQWLTSSEWDWPLDKGPKLAVRHPKRSSKNNCLSDSFIWSLTLSIATLLHLPLLLWYISQIKFSWLTNYKHIKMWLHCTKTCNGVCKCNHTVTKL